MCSGCIVGFWWTYSEVWLWREKWCLRGQNEDANHSFHITKAMPQGDAFSVEVLTRASGTGFFNSLSIPPTLSYCDESISKHSRHFYKIEMLKTHHRLTDIRSPGRNLGGILFLSKFSWEAFLGTQPASPTTIPTGLGNHCYKHPQLKSHAAL